MKSLTAIHSKTSCLSVFVFLWSFSFSFGQDSFEIGELTQKIQNNNEEIQTLNHDLKIIETIESNVLIEKELDDETLTREVQNLRNYKASQAREISYSLDVLNDMMVEAGSKFSSLVNRFDLASKGSIELKFLLVTTSEELKDIYSTPYWVYDGGDEFGNPIINPNRFEEYTASLSVDGLKKKHDEIMKAISDPIVKKKADTEGKLATLSKENQAAKEKLKSLKDEEVQKDASDKNVMRWGFPVFVFFILAIYLIPLWYVYKQGKLDGQRTENLYQLIYGSGLVVEIITVFLLTSTILLLGITDKLDPEILGTLIGGISGYVLGRSFNNVDTAKLKLSNQQNPNSNSNSDS